LLALAADEIVMGPHVVLGPVDPPVETIYPAASILKVVEQKPIAEIDDETLILADRARKALRQVEGWFTRYSESTCLLSRPTAWPARCPTAPGRRLPDHG
jgi:hypothetical protein